MVLVGTCCLVTGAALIRLVLTLLRTDPELRRKRTIWISYVLYVVGVGVYVLYESLRHGFYVDSLMLFVPMILVPLLGLGVRIALGRSE